MPEAYLDFDKKSQRTSAPLHEISTISYENLHSKRQLNRNRNNFTVTNYRPLIEQQSIAQAAPNQESPQPASASNKRKEQLCCCCCCRDASNKDKLNCCWRTKRKQIIWESAQASAKNSITTQTADIATTTTTTTTTANNKTITNHAASSTSKLSTATLLPTVLATKTNSRRYYSYNSNLYKQQVQCNNSNCSNINNNNNHSKISTSLPATPNLRQSRRVQYKHLLLEREVAQQQQQHLRKQATKMSTTHFQTFTTAAPAVCLPNSSEKLLLQHDDRNMLRNAELQATMSTIIRATSVDMPHEDDEFASLAKKVTAITATTTTTTTKTTATQQTRDDTNIPAAEADGECGGTNSTEAQRTNLALLSHAGGITTTTTPANTPPSMDPALSDLPAKKSSLTFCERCCEGASLRSSSNYAHKHNGSKNGNSGPQWRHPTPSAVEDSDRSSSAVSNSVSDLSSFRIVSDEEDELTCVYRRAGANDDADAGAGEAAAINEQGNSNSYSNGYNNTNKSCYINSNNNNNNNNNNKNTNANRAHVDVLNTKISLPAAKATKTKTTTQKQNQNQNQKQKPNNKASVSVSASVCATTTSTQQLALATPTSSLTSLTPHSTAAPIVSASPSPTVCCYRIDKAATVHYSATVVQHTPSAAFGNSAPLPIRPPPEYVYEAPEVIAHTYQLSDDYNGIYSVAESSVGSESSSCGALSTSLPKNYGSSRLDVGSLATAKLPPPPVPPKPPKSHASCNKRVTPYTRTRRERHAYYDPNSFQRKVQKFEKQNTLIGRRADSNEPTSEWLACPPSALSSSLSAAAESVYARQLRTRFSENQRNPFVTAPTAATPTAQCTLERSLSPEHCELLGCFGVTKNTRTQATASAEAIEQQQQQQQLQQQKQQQAEQHIAAQQSCVARSLSDSSCCSTFAPTECSQQSVKNNNNSNALANIDRSAPNLSNNNYNCRSAVPVSQPTSQTQAFAELPVASLPQHALRYDSHGRLKSTTRVSHLPTPVLPLSASGAHNKGAASDTRLPREATTTTTTQQQQIAAVIKSEQLPATKVNVVSSSAVPRLTPTLCRKLFVVRNAADEFLAKRTTNNTGCSAKPNTPYTAHNTSSNINNSADNISAEKVPPEVPTVPSANNNKKIDLDLKFYNTYADNNNENRGICEKQQQQHLYKSYSDNHSFPINIKHNRNTTISTPSLCSNKNSNLKSLYTTSDSNLPCECACKQTNSPISPISPTSPTSPASLHAPLHAELALGLHQKNSHSLPSVTQSLGTSSPIWLSSDTLPSRCSEHSSSNNNNNSSSHNNNNFNNKCLEDAQSNCSDQTTIFHLDNDCSLSASSSSPSSQSVGQHGLRGPLILKRIPAIQSFGFIPTHFAALGSAHVREYNEKESNMEKRRNTLDRFQRLGFGRKTAPSAASSQQQEGGSGSTRARKTTEKSERLRELTELLRGNRSSPTPPPVPPPRKPRGVHSASSSIEKVDAQTATSLPVASNSVDSAQLSFMSTHSDDIMLMDQDEQATDTAASKAQQKQHQQQQQCVNNELAGRSVARSAASTTPTPASTSTAATSTARLFDTLKPNTSLSSFESLMALGREKSKSPPPIAEIDAELAGSTDIATRLARLESRTVIGSYTQKGIPFRSASFSQIDYSSGKYKKSALSALRDRLRRDKAVDASSPTNSIVAEGNESAVVTATTTTAKSEPDWVYIPLKRSELNINLNYGQEVRNLEDVMESPDNIPEEDIFTNDTVPNSSVTEDRKAAIANQIMVAHAKMESLTDTIQSENDYTIDEEQVPLTVKGEQLPEASSEAFNLTVTKSTLTATATAKLTVELSEPNIATLMEEQIPLESPPDNFLQTATTCLIPVPVYECAAQEWRLENPPQEWVEVAPEEFGILPETISPLISLEQCAIAKAETKTVLEVRNDVVPTISVSRSSEEADDAVILRRKETVEVEEVTNWRRKESTPPTDQSKEKVERRQVSADQPEVKKRYSHDDMEIGMEKRAASMDGIATRHSADERKRIDKSKRRKGMYIEHADWTATPDGTPHGRGLALDISIANFNAIKPGTPEECGLMYISSPATDENCTPGSLYSFDLNTPESECNKPPVWTKNLTNFTCQSSEEKEDAPPGNGSAKATGLPRNNKSFPYLRTDSVSDNESDRTPPSSRDRTSPSPAASDYDFKRFSKRPLRGPYGQMLEAEMKKPNKMHFEEILEELRETDSTAQPRRQRVAAHNDDAGGGRSNVPQYSNSMRVRKTSTYLPVPAHARAASTPSQIENVNSKSGVGSGAGGYSVGVGIDKINPHEKRYQSAQDTTMLREKDYSSSYSQQSMPSSTPQTPQTPHYSHQHQHQHSNQNHNQSQHQHQREMKRAASEVPVSKSHHSKRSQSMSSGDKGNQAHLHLHQQKRSLDVTASREKSKGAAISITPATPTTPAGLMPTQELLAELLKGSSEKLLSEQRQQMFADTRTHVVQEIFRNEQSYVESLQTVVTKYLKALKSTEHAGMIDTRTVDEIFFMVPDILEIHQKFLAELKSRLDNWDSLQKVGDAFMETFSKLEVLEVYTSFVNNCNRAKNAIRSTKHQRPSFAKFLESTAREHKGKLTLDNLLIKPVQKFPNYEMLFQRLIKHTDHDHPDQKHLQDVLKLVHDILVHINCKEREILENGQREATLRELEGVIEGITDLIAPDRQFLLFDLVSMPSGQGARKERGFFLFNDLLVLTSIKKRSGTIRKPNTTTCPGTVASTLDTNKYKFLTKISLDCLEIVKTKDENVKRIMAEIENLAEDCNKLTQIAEITAALKYPHQYLEDVIRELLRDVQRQLSERQTNDAQLNMLELIYNSPNGSQKLSIVFSKAEKRTQWEETFNEAKQKLAATLERHPIPEFLMSIPIRKTRAGLQFTCAAATLSEKRDVWVCNSDGYVGQVCIMSLHPEPNVTSCNGVCNARILCVASVPAFSGSTCSSASTVSSSGSAGSNTLPEPQQRTPQHHSYTQQLRDYRKSISPNCQPVTTIGSAEVKRKTTPVSAAAAAAVVSAAAAGNSSNNNSNNSDTQLDLNLSSSDDEADTASTATATATVGSAGVAVGGTIERVPSPAPSLHTNSSTASTLVLGSGGGGSGTALAAIVASVAGSSSQHSHQDSNPDESDGNQSTMWIGTEDGCIHVYNSTDNIRIKKNRIKIEHHSAVYSILYLDNRVFVSLANGDICVYLRDGAAWNTSSSHCLSIGTVTSPVTKLLNVHGRLWCSIQGIIKVLDIETLVVVNQIQISSDSKPITNMTVAHNYVWISIQNSAHIKCFHSNSHQLITEVNLAPAVNKMLSNCDEIIRQHKAACLRVTSLLSCKDLIWIGTSAGVLLTIPAQGYEKSGAPNIVPTGIPHGHTGHVRFLTFVETTGMSSDGGSGAGVAAGTGSSSASAAAKDGSDSASASEYRSGGSIKHKAKNETTNILIISGGDGYEDFRNSGANSLSEIAGREDSTNHLLIWQI